MDSVEDIIRLAQGQELAIYIVEILKRLDQIGAAAAVEIVKLVPTLPKEQRQDITAAANWLSWKLKML